MKTMGNPAPKRIVDKLGQWAEEGGRKYSRKQIEAAYAHLVRVGKSSPFSFGEITASDVLAVLNKKRGNPAQASAEAFEEFHGRPSEEVITVTQKVHYHSNLAAIGKLEALKGVTCAGSPFLLEGFGGALLCMNEKKTQLFVRGGNQKVDPADFGADAEHELQTLGYVKVIEYFTTKNHLGKEGGTAVYVHKFSRPYPDLIYDVVNKQLLFAGGSYSMPPEGIDN